MHFSSFLKFFSYAVLQRNVISVQACLRGSEQALFYCSCKFGSLSIVEVEKNYLLTKSRIMILDKKIKPAFLTIVRLQVLFGASDRN